MINGETFATLSGSNYWPSAGPPLSSSVTILLPGQDKPAPSGPMSRATCFVVDCGVRFSVCGLDEFRKPQVGFLSSQSNSLNFITQKGYQRWLDRLPYTARIERPQLHRGGSASTETMPAVSLLPLLVHLSLSMRAG